MSNSAEWLNPTNLFNAHPAAEGWAGGGQAAQGNGASNAHEWRDGGRCSEDSYGATRSTFYLNFLWGGGPDWCLEFMLQNEPEGRFECRLGWTGNAPASEPHASRWVLLLNTCSEDSWMTWMNLL